MDTTESQQKPEARVSKVQAVLMICAAVLLDLIGLIPAVGQYFSIIGAFVIFGIWFLILGVPLKEKIKGILLNGVAEVIPVVGEFWVGITAGVILILVDEVDGLGFLKFLKTFKGGAKGLAKGAGQTLGKEARRLENPERAAQARERLQRLRERRAPQETVPQTKNRVPMNDFTQQS